MDAISKSLPVLLFVDGEGGGAHLQNQGSCGGLLELFKKQILALDFLS